MLDADTGEGIPGAIVTLGDPLTRFVTSERRSISDRAGRFTFPDVLSGAYAGLIGEASGYVAGRFGQLSVSDSPQALNVGPGETEGPVLWLHRAAAISGVVLDEFGEPAAEVRVRAYRRSTSVWNSQFKSASTAVTDDRGIYRLFGLSAGEYVVGLACPTVSVPSEYRERRQPSSRVEAMALSLRDRTLMSSGAPAFYGDGIALGDATIPVSASSCPGLAATMNRDGSVRTYQPSYYPVAESPETATRIILGPGETKTAVNLQALPSSGVAVSGRIFGPDGPSAHVGVKLKQDVDHLFDFGGESGNTATDGEGRFRFLGVVPGSYRIEVRASEPVRLAGGEFRTIEVEGFRSVMISDKDGRPRPMPVSKGLRWGTSRVAVGQSHVTGVELMLQPGLSLNGQIRFRGQSPRPPAEALREILVGVERADSSYALPSSPVARGVVQDSGAFEAEALPAGRYLVRASNLPAGWYLDSVLIDGRDVSDEAFLLDHDVAEVQLVLSDTACRLSGTVQQSVGRRRPIDVVLVPVEPRRWEDFGLHPRRLLRTRVLDDREFKFEGFPPGDYAVAALTPDASGEWTTERALDLALRQGERISVGGGEEQRVMNLKVVLRGGTPSFGRVVLASFFKTISIDSVPTAERYRPPSRTAQGGQLAATQALRGIVALPDGGPVRRALVRLSGQNLVADRIVMSDGEGVFLFSDLPEGFYSLSARKAGLLPTWFGSSTPGHGPGEALRLPVARDVRVTLTMRPGASVNGTVRGIDGRPMVGATVEALRVEPGSEGRVLTSSSGHAVSATDDLGEFRLYGLLPGQYLVAARRRSGRAEELVQTSVEDGTLRSRAVTIGATYFPASTSPGDSEPITLALGQERIGVDMTMRAAVAATLAGRVTTPPGSPVVGGVRVTLRSIGIGPAIDVATTAAGADGAFAIHNVAPGNYELDAQATRQGAGATGRIATLRYWARTVAVADGHDMTGIVLQLHQGLMVRGIVRLDTGTATPDTLRLIRVRLTSIDREPASIAASATPSPDGSFLLPELLPGRYVVTAFLQPPADTALTILSASVADQDLRRQPLSLSTAGIDEMVVTLTSHPSEIVGMISDDRARPAGGLTVMAVSTDRRGWFQESPLVRSAQPSLAGQFRIAGLPDGEYVVAAVPGFAMTGRIGAPELEEILKVGSKVQVRAGQTIRHDIVIAAPRGSK